MYSKRRFVKRLLWNKWVASILVVWIVGLAFQFVVCSGGTACLDTAGTLLFSRETGVVAAVAAALLSLYRFVYLRPELLLDIDPNSRTVIDGDEGKESVITLHLVNAGNRFAENVHLSFALDAFKFDTDVETSDNLTDDYEIPQTTLKAQSGRRIGYIGGGRRHDVLFDSVIYENDVHELYFGKSVFDSPGEYEIKYTVACRTHGLRQGKIHLDITDENVCVTREYPTIFRQLKAAIFWNPELKRTQRVTNLDDVDIQTESL